MIIKGDKDNIAKLQILNIISNNAVFENEERKYTENVDNTPKQTKQTKQTTIKIQRPIKILPANTVWKSGEYGNFKCDTNKMVVGARNNLYKVDTEQQLYILDIEKNKEYSCNNIVRNTIWDNFPNTKDKNCFCYSGEFNSTIE